MTNIYEKSLKILYKCKNYHQKLLRKRAKLFFELLLWTRHVALPIL